MSSRSIWLASLTRMPGATDRPYWQMLGARWRMVPGASLWQSLQASASCPVLGGPLAWKRTTCGITTMSATVTEAATPPSP
jgi:hypothetical protein